VITVGIVAALGALALAISGKLGNVTDVLTSNLYRYCRTVVPQEGSGLVPLAQPHLNAARDRLIQVLISMGVSPFRGSTIG
jgi:hypothetical protein